ncbi:serine/threonine protein phosphatase [Tissierella creatinini]|nr:serine/threonine protein phosphatase [Tissierella creatinini]TJX60680.1 serine/threonine protein phosphatase [Soehngenia saccharolytica]
MRKFVIGDIHGCYEDLQELLGKIKPDLRKDKIIFLGDYIDRGKDSYSVIKLLKGLQEKHGKNHIVLLRGNHEQMAIDNIEGGYYRSFNGFDTTVRDFKRNNESIADYLDFFQSLPLYHEDEDFIYVHGGIKPGVSIDQQSESDLLWIREEFYDSKTSFEKPVIFGHTPTHHLTGAWVPFIKEDRVGIDTGCVYGGHLTAIEIRSGQIVDIYESNRIAA